MKIAIHSYPGSFSSEWISYCEEKNYDYVILDFFKHNAIEELLKCDLILWHFQHGVPKDMILAKYLLGALEISGKVVFPSTNDSWHFDNKLAQSYLFKSLKLKTPITEVYFSLRDVNLDLFKFPIIVKLKGGSGSRNVKKINNLVELKKYARRIFSSGIRQYDAFGGIVEAIRRWKLGKMNLIGVIKAFLHLVVPIKAEKVMAKEWGYLYTQEYLKSDCDFRVIVIYGKIFAIKRKVRQNDFRASGSGHIDYNVKNIDFRLIERAIDYSNILKSKCIAFDFVLYEEEVYLLEISYGWNKKGYYDCPGYWNENKVWVEEAFNPYGWMIEGMKAELKEKLK
jgi:glutathione synthase/RimK-type ligase-like ATP-grasp enzyme